MAYVLLTGGKIGVVYYTEPIDKTGLIEVEIPEPEQVDGKIAIMEWENGIKYRYIDEPSEVVLDDVDVLPPEPSLEERIQALEVMELERILGGGF